MVGRMLSVLALTVVLAAAVAAAASDARVCAAAATARPFVVYDAIGDAVGVGDITSVAVARDAGDTLTFAVNVAGHPSMKRGDLFSIGIDADRSLATGMNGFDRVLMLGWPKGDQQPTYRVGAWNGSDWEDVDVPADVSYPETGPRFVVAAAEIGVGRSFRFDARAERLTAPNRDAMDRVPGKGLASVALGRPSTIAEIDRMTIPFSSLLPEAGKVLRVRGIVVFEEVVSGVGAGVKPERVRCTAKIGGTALRPVASCAWRVPGTARGKTLMLKVSVAHHGGEVTEVYPLRVG